MAWSVAWLKLGSSTVQVARLAAATAATVRIASPAMAPTLRRRMWRMVPPPVNGIEVDRDRRMTDPGRGQAGLNSSSRP
jgi:hypothetical protein